MLKTLQGKNHSISIFKFQLSVDFRCCILFLLPQDRPVPRRRSDQEHRTASLPPPLQPIPPGCRHSSSPTPAHSHRPGRWKVSTVLSCCPASGGWCLSLPWISWPKADTKLQVDVCPWQSSRCPAARAGPCRNSRWSSGSIGKGGWCNTRGFSWYCFLSACICPCVIHCVLCWAFTELTVCGLVYCIRKLVYSSFLSYSLELVFHCFLFMYGSMLVKLNPVTILNAW